MRIFLFFLFPILSFANPQGLQCIAGDAFVVTDIENQLTVQSSQPSILHWDRFSIDTHESVQFIQKGAVLNRVTGSEPSSILGSLSSNGEVYLINPQGIFIGPNGRIDTAGFIASTLDILNENFLEQNELRFQGTSTAGIVHLGTIHCRLGDATLFARKIQSAGTIETPLGRTSLGCGTQILLKTEGNQRVYIQAAALEDEIPLIHNGRIEALAIELKSSNPYSQAIKCSGLIEATRIEERGSEIYLVANEGSCDLKDATLVAEAGTIHLLGKTVHLESTLVDVSADEGGGTILIGGDYKGKNPDVPNATRISLDRETFLKADALTQGDGGKVICWGDEETAFYGHINICGGPHGGNGGFAEVSGKHLIYQGLADGRALLGKYGVLLLDPVNITIGGAATTGSFSACPDSNYIVDTGISTNQILNTDLNNQLSMCSVTVDTGDSGSGGAGVGTISVSSPVTWVDATTLTFIANRRIEITADITGVNGSMDFTNAGVGSASYNGITISAAVTTQGGNITMMGVGGTFSSNDGIQVAGVGNRIATTSGDIQLTGTASASSSRGVIVSTSGLIETDSGSITIMGTATGGGTAPNGIRIETANGVRSTTGDITLTGVSTNSGGVNAPGGVAHASTAGTITYLNCQASGSGSSGVSTLLQTPGSVIFNNCEGPARGAVISGISSIGGSVQFENCRATGSGGGGADFLATLAVGGDISFNLCEGGSGVSHGIRVGAAITIGGNLTAMNITGGTGSGSSGIAVLAPVTADGSMMFDTIDGGGDGTGTNHHGISLSSSGQLRAPTITAINVVGGNGTQDCQGVQLNAPAILGGVGATSISITAEGGSTDGGNDGIRVNGGTIQASSVALNGTGGGSGTGSENCGVRLITAAASYVGINTLALVGQGGSGTGGSNFGVDIETAINSGSLDITGTGGDGANSFDIQLVADLTSSQNITFNSPTRLSGATRTVNATNTITFVDTVDGITSGGSSLTLNAASISVQDAIGFLVPLNIFQGTGTTFLQQGDIRAVEGTIDASLQITGNRILQADGP